MMTDFYGLPTHSVANSHLRLDCLAEAGPRIVRLVPAGSEDNVLAELPDVSWRMSLGLYHLHGGHRLWHAPEIRRRTDIPDDSGVTVENRPDGLDIIGPVEPYSRVRKVLEVRFHPDRPAVTINHRIENHGLWRIELAPWPITLLPLGGVVFLPQARNRVDLKGLHPNRHLTIWPYARWDDPRLVCGESWALVVARPLEESQPGRLKIGYLNREGWLAYWRKDRLFVKRFPDVREARYPDHDCNVEVHLDANGVELETLGPLQRLEPGAVATHTEEWEILRAPELPASAGDVPDALAEAFPSLRSEQRLRPDLRIR